LHQLRAIIAERLEGIKKGRDKNDAAPHAQKPGQHTGKASDHKEQNKHLDQEHGVRHRGGLS